MLNLLGRFLSTLGIILFPPSKLKLTYFVFLVVQILSLILLCGIHLFPEGVEPIMSISLLVLGLASGTYMFPFLLLFYNFQSEDE